VFGNKVMASSTTKGQNGIFQRVIAGPVGGELPPAWHAAPSNVSTACQANGMIRQAPERFETFSLKKKERWKHLSPSTFFGREKSWKCSTG